MSIYRFLGNKDFYLKDNSKHIDFDNYYDIFTKNVIEVRFIKDKSHLSIDIRSALKNSQWYDLTLVKNLLLHDIQLNRGMTIQEYQNFLITYMDDISCIFNEKNYHSTTVQLDELSKERVKQMFPFWYRT